MVKAVIFDYGGVMTKGTIRNICLWYEKTYGFDLEEFTQILRKYWNAAKVGTITSEVFWQGLSQELHRSEPMLREELISHILPDAQMVSYVKRLRKNYTLALLSNHVKDWLEEAIRRHDLRSVFSVIVTSYETGIAKPDTNIFYMLQKKLQLPFHEMLFIDDKEKNVAAAKLIGMNAVLFTDFQSMQSAVQKLL